MSAEAVTILGNAYYGSMNGKKRSELGHISKKAPRSKEIINSPKQPYFGREQCMYARDSIPERSIRKPKPTGKCGKI